MWQYVVKQVRWGSVGKRPVVSCFIVGFFFLLELHETRVFCCNKMSVIDLFIDVFSVKTDSFFPHFFICVCHQA